MTGRKPFPVPVILTREPPDNAPLKKMLEERGFEVVEYPCIQTIVLPPDSRQLESLISACSVAAFTSKRAVEALTGVSALLSSSPVYLAAVGLTTARKMEAVFGRRPDIIADAQTGESLAYAILNRFGDGKADSPGSRVVLHLRGTKYNPVFARILETNGWAVRSMVVYETAPASIEPLPPERYIAVFASPSAAERFFDVNTGSEIQVFPVAAGPVTATAIRSITGDEPTVSAAPQPKPVARCVADLARRIENMLK